MTLGANYRAIVSFTISSDRSSKMTMGWTFSHDTSLSPQGPYSALAAAFIAFYNSGPESPYPLIGKAAGRGANDSECSIYAITLGSDVLGPPLYSTPFQLGAENSGNTELPVDNCVVLSLRGAYNEDEEFGTKTRPRASDRGRVYLGPWNSQAVGLDSSTPPRVIVSPSIQTYLGAQLSTLMSALEAQGCRLTVWSRKLAKVSQVVDYAVNEEWDTQRRRSKPAQNLSWIPTIS
jgi:hypothetical protein